MDGIHDLGGVEGYGPVPYLPEERAQVTTHWEGVAGAATFAMMRAGVTNIDAHRHRIERLDPERYFPVGYWGRWLAAVEAAMVDQGVTDADAIDERLRSRGHDPRRSAAPPRMHPNIGLEAREHEPGFLRTVGEAPRFAVDDEVVTLTHAPHDGHHRLPRYARGRRGRIARVYPAFTFPDTMAHGRGEAPCYVYAVAFAATELWGPGADPAQVCHLDTFEPYLRPAPDRPSEQE
ncbi:MAG: nitrile hydratase subunit beta [Actinomycetota bacterium]